MTNETPSSCPYCAERFLRAEHRILHIGRIHPEAMDEDERAAFVAAVQAEEAWFRNLQKHVRAGLTTLPVFVLYVLTVALLFQAQGNPAFAIMLFPGFVAFSALIYGITFSYLSVKGSNGRAGDTQETPDDAEKRRR